MNIRNIVCRLIAVAILPAVLVACGSSSEADPPSTSRVQAAAVRLSSAQQANGVKIAGYRVNYTITKAQGTGIVTLTNKITNEVQTYQNPSLIKFADMYTSFDVSGPPGQVYRLYQAAFNRTPDLPGLGFWIAANQNGRDLAGIASDFIASTEFKTAYGENVSDAGLVNLLYNNILHRSGESAGVTWWEAALASGASRPGVLFGFSDSAENEANVNPSLVGGFDYVPFNPSGPIPVQRTSYLNAKANGLPSQTIPVEAGGSPQFGFAFFHSYGFADFFQDSTYSMITSSNDYLNDPKATLASAKPGHIKFWKKDTTGNWVDHTQDLLTDDTGCILARKVVVADFNGDGKPDVFLSCSGFDAEPFPGEHPRILMSQANGTYKNVMLDVNCYCHGASAADFDNNGFADIVVADFLGGKGSYFLKNNKDGTFTVDNTRLPDSIHYKGAIFSAEIVDLNNDGKLDVWLAGNESDQWPTSAFIGDGKNDFSKAKQIVLPADNAYPSPMDLVVNGNFAYLLRTNNDVSGAEIQKIDLTTMQASTVYTNTNYYPTQQLKWVDWITISGKNIVSVNSVFNLSISQ